jgi:bacterioferritin-associated ferredoxin
MNPCLYAGVAACMMHIVAQVSTTGGFMYVCICKGVTENQIRDVIRGGLCTRKEISRCLKVGTACGKCNQEVGDLLRSSLAAGNVRSLLRDEEYQTFKISSPGRLSLPESPAGAVKPDTARVVQVMERAACLG